MRLESPTIDEPESLALSGFAVGITADRRWEEQAELLRRRGASTLHGPSIRTLPLGPEAALSHATQRLIEDPPDYVIANTAIGMRAWFGAAESWGIGEALVGALACAQIYCRGPKASGAVHAAGLTVAGRAGTERLDEVMHTLLSMPIRGKTIAFQLHGDESPGVTKTLEEAGATVVEVPVYSWTMPADERPAVKLIESAIERRLHAVTFTSAPAVTNLFRIADANGTFNALLDALNGDVVAACVGHVCAEAGAQLGLRDLLVPDRSRLGPMIRTLTDVLASTRRRCSVNGQIFDAQGTAVFIGGIRVDLSEREAAVLAVLIRRAGVVVLRSALLAEVWGPGADPHTMEVTIGRLRRRLGPVGEAIESVPRRGYVLRTSALELVSTAEKSA